MLSCFRNMTFVGLCFRNIIFVGLCFRNIRFIGLCSRNMTFVGLCFRNMAFVGLWLKNMTFVVLHFRKMHHLCCISETWHLLVCFRNKTEYKWVLLQTLLRWEDGETSSYQGEKNIAGVSLLLQLSHSYTPSCLLILVLYYHV